MRWVLALLLVPLAACGGSASPPAAAPSSPNYAQSTCRDFTESFSDAQRRDAAAIALIRLRRDDGRPGPTDSEVDSFTAGMYGACRAAPTATVVQTAVSVYR